MQTLNKAHGQNAPQYLQLNKGGVQARMSILRMLALEQTAKCPPSMGINWRGARGYGLKSWASAFGALCAGFDALLPGYASSGKVAIWATHTGECFRDERDAKTRHNCWFTEPDGGDVAIGIIARLPHGRFIAGYRWTCNDERVYYDEVYSDESDASIAADAHAEAFAERAMEDAQTYQAATITREEHDAAIKRMRELIKLRHVECMGYVREEMSELVQSIRSMRDELRGTDFAV